jgi:hypothetical protein
MFSKNYNTLNLILGEKLDFYGAKGMPKTELT